MRILSSVGVRRAGRLILSLLVPALSLPAIALSTAQRTEASTIFSPSHRAEAASSSDGARSIDLARSLGLDYVPGELMVKLPSREALDAPRLGELMDCFGLSVGSELLPGVYKLTSSDGARFDAQAAATALEATGLVGYAHPNRIYSVDLVPNDEQYVARQQWYVTQVHAEEAWDVTTGSDAITIAIIDTGTAYDHPDLGGKSVGGYDFYNNDNDPYDDNGHGTMTAGIAAAVGNNDEGIAGMSWGARIMPIKVLGGPQGEGTDEMVAAGIRWAVDHGANILNVSLGGDETSDIQDDAVRYAHDRNVLFVAAAGNTPDGLPHYPAAYDTAMAVGATVRHDAATGFSSYGPYVDISAPGVGMLSTALDNGYEYGNGTSFACPMVAGAAALVWSINPGFTADQVRFILEDSSDDIGPAGWDEYTGRGRLNAQKAVQLAQQIAGGGVLPTRTPTPIPQPTNQPGGSATAVPSLPTTIQVDSTTVAPGGLLALIGSGFQPNETVDISVQAPASAAARGIGTAQADAAGGFRAEVALPKDVPLGPAKLIARGTASNRQAGVDLTVVSSSSVGLSAIRGTVRGAAPGTVTVYLQPALGVNAPEVSAQTDASGVFNFANLASGFYALSAVGPNGVRIGPYTVQVDGTAGDVKTIDLLIPQPRPRAFDRVPPLTNTAQIVYFPEVGHTLKGPFLKFWNENGGLAIFGYPLSEEFQDVSATDGKTYTVQFFERNRFEFHPEFSGTKNEVLMGLLGVEVTRGTVFQPEAPVQITPNQVYFEATKHSLKGQFLKYWNENGGLAIFGYPISAEMVENGYLVQYFERNRFEYHLEFAGTRNEVLLGLLGSEVARRSGWIAP
ncbi:MAG: S8 family serine peptidase [Chloroflexia bacterium]